MKSSRPTQKNGRMTITVTNFPMSLRRTALRSVKKVLHAERPRQSWDISVAAVPARDMQRVNARYRRKKYVADVLSFLLEAPTRATPGVGEILVCRAQIIRDATALHVPWRTHLARMLVHSCLHLLGYHHDTKQARARMEERERKYIM